MSDNPKNVLNDWIVRIALGIITAAGGFLYHQFVYGQASVRATTNGTPTGWTQEQERDFLEMPREHKNIFIMEDSILQKMSRFEEELKRKK